MADEDKPAQQLSPEKLAYVIAYGHALKELQELEEEEKRIAIRKAQLRDTLQALGPLFLADFTNIESLTLANAIRLVIRGAGRPMSVLEVRSKLTDLRYDLSKYENPLASIHTAMNRMKEAEELRLVESETDKKKMFEPGPELKPVPEAPSPIQNALAARMVEVAKASQEPKK